MGCTSSKKRTTSVDDLTGQTKDAVPVDGQKKNGQLTSANDAVKQPLIAKENANRLGAEAPSADTSKAIQIPGAHNSFLAPDGIPFIDEDVDDDEVEGLKQLQQPAAVVVAKADVNKNVVINREANNPVPAVVVAPPTVIVTAGEERRTDVSKDEDAEESKKKEIAMDILRQELEFTTSKQDEAEVVHVEQVVVTTTTEAAVVEEQDEVERHESPRPVTEEEQQRAAVKIQAGIRGYRDRQKVKALRASKDSTPTSPDSAEVHSAIDVTENTPTIIIQEEPVANEIDIDSSEVPSGAMSSVISSDEQHLSDSSTAAAAAVEPPPSPEMERAAVKIQASYKGYKTRKEYSERLHKVAD